MINRKKCVGGRRLVYPFRYFYGEANCEPYWTDEPVMPFTSFYDEIKKRKDA